MQLVINTRRTSLRRKGDRFLIKSADKQVAFSAQKVHSIVIATGMHFSSDVIHLAAEHNVDVVFLDRSGQPISRVWQPKMGSTATIRRRMKKAYFRDIPGGIELSPDGRAALMTDLNKRLDQSIKVYSRKPAEPDANVDATLDAAAEKPTPRKFRRLKQRTAIQHEAHATANLLLGRHDIPRIVETEVLLADP